MKTLYEVFDEFENAKSKKERMQVIGNKLRRLYMFLEGNQTAETLTDKRRNELLIQMLESIEPREAEVLLGIFQKDLGVKGLDYKFVKEAFPDLLP